MKSFRQNPIGYTAERVLTSKPVAQTLGIQEVEHVRVEIEEIEVDMPLYHVSDDSGLISDALSTIQKAGFSANPVGVFLKEQYIDEPGYIEHESYHYWEQEEEGLDWYVGYAEEYVEGCIAYLDSYDAYKYHEDEQEANIYAGWQDDYIDPDPWWEDYYFWEEWW